MWIEQSFIRSRRRRYGKLARQLELTKGQLALTVRRYRGLRLIVRTTSTSSGIACRRAALDARLPDCGLTLHPDKTKLVYSKDESRRASYPTVKFDFLGSTFRPRRVSKRSGGMGSHSVLPPVRRRSRRSGEPFAAGLCIGEVTRLSMIWPGCSTRISAVGSTAMGGAVLLLSIPPCCTLTFVCVAGLRGSTRHCEVTSGARGTGSCALRVASRNCSLIGHSSRATVEQWEPDEVRGSRPVLRAREGAIPPCHSPR